MGAIAATKIETTESTEPKIKKPRKKRALAAVPDTSPTVTRTSDGLHLTMNITTLRKAIVRLSTIADMKSTMPMLHHVLVRADGMSVEMSATDLNTTLTVRYEMSVREPGEIAIDAKRLREILRVLPDGDVVLEANRMGTEAMLAIAGCKAKVLALHGRDFPKVPSTNVQLVRADLTWHTMDAGILRALIEDTYDSVCRDETRFHLNGAFLEAGDGSRVSMVTTDGHRLMKSQRMYAHTFCPKSGGGIIIPAHALRELQRLLVDGTCEIAQDKMTVFIRQGEWTLSTKAIDAQFPPYEQVIPKEAKHLLTVDREALIGALRRCKVVTTDERGVTLKATDGKLLVSGAHPDIGELCEAIASQHIDRCHGVAVGVNPHYLIAALDRLAGDQCVLAVSGELDPIMVRGIDDAAMRSIENSETVGVVMPMRI